MQHSTNLQAGARREYFSKSSKDTQRIGTPCGSGFFFLKNGWHCCQNLPGQVRQTKSSPCLFSLALLLEQSVHQQGTPTRQGVGGRLRLNLNAGQHVVFMVGRSRNVACGYVLGDCLAGSGRLEGGWLWCAVAVRVTGETIVCPAASKENGESSPILMSPPAPFGNIFFLPTSSAIFCHKESLFFWITPIWIVVMVSCPR